MKGVSTMDSRENKKFPHIPDDPLETKDSRYLEGDGEKEFLKRSVENPGKEYNASKPAKEYGREGLDNFLK